MPWPEWLGGGVPRFVWSAAPQLWRRLPGWSGFSVRSALEMQQALADRFPHTDALIMSAAVSDYRPAGFAEQKMKRERAGNAGQAHS